MIIFMEQTDLCCILSRREIIQQFAWLHHCIMHRDLVVGVLTSSMLEALTQGCGSALNLQNCLENLPAQAENPFIHAYDDGNEEKILYLHVGGGEKNSFLGRNKQDEKNFVRLCYMIYKENK